MGVLRDHPLELDTAAGTVRYLERVDMSDSWNFTPPLILDTQASTALGYQSVGTYAQTVTAEIDWLLVDPANQPSPAAPSAAVVLWLRHQLATEWYRFREAVSRC
jgi:hypothetical protein